MPALTTRRQSPKRNIFIQFMNRRIYFTYIILVIGRRDRSISRYNILITHWSPQIAKWTPYMILEPVPHPYASTCAVRKLLPARRTRWRRKVARDDPSEANQANGHFSSAQFDRNLSSFAVSSSSWTRMYRISIIPGSVRDADDEMPDYVISVTFDGCNFDGFCPGCGPGVRI